MKKLIVNTFGIAILIALSSYFIFLQDDLFYQASKVNILGPVHLSFSKVSYNMNFEKLSSLDELRITSEIKKIHQIEKQVSGTFISKESDIMLTFAKTIDQKLVLVIFKKQQIQMIQRISEISDRTIKFQYGQLVMLDEAGPIAVGAQNVELEF